MMSLRYYALFEKHIVFLCELCMQMLHVSCMKFCPFVQFIILVIKSFQSKSLIFKFL